MLIRMSVITAIDGMSCIISSLSRHAGSGRPAGGPYQGLEGDLVTKYDFVAELLGASSQASGAAD